MFELNFDTLLIGKSKKEKQFVIVLFRDLSKSVIKNSKLLLSVPNSERKCFKNASEVGKDKLAFS